MWTLQRMFGVRWLGGALLVGVVDGAFLGGVAAIISAIGTLLLGVLAYWKGHRVGAGKVTTEADAWRLLAEARERELEQLRAQAGDHGD